MSEPLYVFSEPAKSPTDLRDFNFPYDPSVPRPRRIVNYLPSDVALNQQITSACTGHENKSDLDETCLYYGVPFSASALDPYYYARLADNPNGPMADVGTYPRSMSKVMQKRGCARNSLWPFDPSKVNEKPSDEADADAGFHKIDSYSFLPVTNGPIFISAYMAACAAGYNVKISMTIRRWIYDLTGPVEGHNSQRLAAMAMGRNDVIGNHQMLGKGYDLDMPGGAVAFFRTSWGPDAGENGILAIPFSSLYEVYDASVTHGFMDCNLMYEPTDVQLTQLYVSLFGRSPDWSGISYWRGNIADGQTIKQIAQNMFINPLSRSYYPSSLTNRGIAEAFYLRVLGREPDAAGWDYWEAALNNPANTPGDVIVMMMTAVQGYSGTDPIYKAARQRFLNHTDVGAFCGITLSCSDITICQAALGGVTADTTSIGPAKAALRVAMGVPHGN